MEYTKSIGDVWETYEGTPEEIAKLMELQGNGNSAKSITKEVEGTEKACKSGSCKNGAFA